MAKRRASDNGSTAVAERDDDDQESFKDEVTQAFRARGILAEGSPEQSLPATLDPDLPIQGPILDPQEVAVYEREHYSKIRERNEAVRLLDEQHDRAKAAAKRAKYALDDAQTELSEFISRGPLVPGRQWAKRIRLVREIEANTELGEGFLPIPAGELFEVHDIQDPDVLVMVGENLAVVPYGSYEVIEWTSQPAKPPAPAKQPKRIRMLVTVGNDELGFTAPDAELDAIVDADGDVSIMLGGEAYPLEPDEFEVIDWAAPIDPNGWRNVSIGELSNHGINPGLVEKLVDAGITTLGKLLDFQKDGVPLTTIKGIAGEKEARIADAMVAYWQANPQYCQNAAEAAE